MRKSAETVHITKPIEKPPRGEEEEEEEEEVDAQPKPLLLEQSFPPTDRPPGFGWPTTSTIVGASSASASS